MTRERRGPEPAPLIEESPGRDPGYAVTPARLGSDGRRRLPLLVALVGVGIALAIVKPWGSGEPGPGTSVSPSPVAAVDLPSPTPSASATPAPVPSGTPQPATSSAPGSSAVAGGAADAAGASAPIAPDLLPNAGRWRIATGGWWPTGGDPWTWATADVGLYEGDDAASALRAGPTCAGRPRLPVGSFVAVSAPSGLAGSGSLAIAAYRDPGGRPGGIPSTFVVAREADRGVAFLFRDDRRPWAAGAYRLVLRTPAGPVAIDACLAGSGPATAAADVRVPSLDVEPGLGPLAAATERDAGTWGIGSGGYRPTGAPWSSWQRVAPRRASSYEAVDLLAIPACGDMDPIPSGLLMTVTTPTPIADPNSVAVVHFRTGRPSTFVGGLLRPVRADSRVVHLARADGEPWGSGAFRFIVGTLDGPVVLDACLIAYPTLPAPS